MNLSRRSLFLGAAALLASTAIPKIVTASSVASVSAEELTRRVFPEVGYGWPIVMTKHVLFQTEADDGRLWLGAPKLEPDACAMRTMAEWRARTRTAIEIVHERRAGRPGKWELKTDADDAHPFWDMHRLHETGVAGATGAIHTDYVDTAVKHLDWIRDRAVRAGWPVRVASIL